MTQTIHKFLLISLLILSFRSDSITGNENDNKNVEPHPDPNDENYDNMIYVGRMEDEDDTKRAGFHTYNNGIKYIFGTGFDETHKDIEEEELKHHTPDNIDHDLPHDRKTKSRDEVIHEREKYRELHGTVPDDGKPKPFGHVDIHELDGGVVPPKVVYVDPFFMDATLVTNKQFGKFVGATYYETEAEKYGWSFVLSSFMSSSDSNDNEELDVDPEAEHWVAVDGAYWRRPEGPKSTYKGREDHPVVHVSHKDAAEYCKWVGGKRLPGEREWECAARSCSINGQNSVSNRTLYVWGDDQDLSYNISSQHANLWGTGKFPNENFAEDKWRGTSPVKYYKANKLGFYDMTGNVWEWMRGGKHKARIVRGGSYVDTVDGSQNHAATLGARSTAHGTTTTGNIGFRCVKSPKRRTEYHYVHEQELDDSGGTLGIQNSQTGKVDSVKTQKLKSSPLSSYANDDDNEDIDDDEFIVDAEGRKKRKVVKKRTTYSNEL